VTEATVDRLADDAPLPSAGSSTRRGMGVLSRFGWLLVVVWAAVTVTFVLSRIVPADPARLAAGMQAGPEQVAEVRHQLGLDRPLPEQYFAYISGLVRGDFGDSVQTRRPVLDDLGTYLPATLELVIVSFILFSLVGVALGVIWAVWPGGLHAWLIRIGSLLGAAVPVFWIGLVLQLVFGSRLGWFPIAGTLEYSRFDVAKHTGAGTVDALLALDPPAFGNALWHLVLPVMTIVVSHLALTTRLTRASLSEQLDLPYVRTARARGVSGRRVVIVDALRNAANPVITMLGLQFGWLLGSTILIEVMFSWPGLGSYAFNAFRTFDYNPIMAITIVVTVGFVLVNELVNAMYPRLDPRLRERR
jgi:ABC-type dipeptide/oligopeptide/nickel transport system permease component